MKKKHILKKSWCFCYILLITFNEGIWCRIQGQGILGGSMCVCVGGGGGGGGVFKLMDLTRIKCMPAFILYWQRRPVGGAYMAVWTNPRTLFCYQRGLFGGCGPPHARKPRIHACHSSMLKRKTHIASKLVNTAFWVSWKFIGYIEGEYICRVLYAFAT